MTADEIVQARRKPGYSGDVTVTLYTGDTVLWRVGECIPMRRAEAEQRDDVEIVEASKKKSAPAVEEN